MNGTQPQEFCQMSSIMLSITEGPMSTQQVVRVEHPDTGEWISYKFDTADYSDGSYGHIYDVSSLYGDMGHDSHNDRDSATRFRHNYNTNDVAHPRVQRWEAMHASARSYTDTELELELRELRQLRDSYPPEQVPTTVLAPLAALLREALRRVHGSNNSDLIRDYSGDREWMMPDDEPFPGERREYIVQRCQFFYNCNNPVSRPVHTFLGWVPACHSCREFYCERHLDSKRPMPTLHALSDPRD